MINQISTELKITILLIGLGYALMIISSFAKAYLQKRYGGAKIINSIREAGFGLIVYSALIMGSRILFVVLKNHNWLISVVALLGLVICPVCLVYFARLVERWIQGQDSEDHDSSISNHQKGGREKVEELIDRTKNW